MFGSNMHSTCIHIILKTRLMQNEIFLGGVNVDKLRILCSVQTYSITLKTGNRKNAGTDSNVYFQVFGDRGDTGVIELKQICEPTGMLQKASSF